MSQLLEENPQLLSLVHRDLAKMLSQSKQGRKSRYTSEQILRSLIVLFVERISFRRVVVHIENSEFLRHFVGLGVKSMMDFTFLDRAFCVLSEQTWEAMNGVLARYAKEQDKSHRIKCVWTPRFTKPIFIIPVIHLYCGTVFVHWLVCCNKFSRNCRN